MVALVIFLLLFMTFCFSIVICLFFINKTFLLHFYIFFCLFLTWSSLAWRLFLAFAISSDGWDWLIHRYCKTSISLSSSQQVPAEVLFSLWTGVHPSCRSAACSFLATRWVLHPLPTVLYMLSSWVEAVWSKGRGRMRFKPLSWTSSRGKRLPSASDPRRVGSS